MQPLIASPQCIRAARAAARAVCLHNGIRGERMEDVVLVTSELVGNAIRHGRSPLAYDVAMDGNAVRVVVQDAAPRPPGHVSPAQSSAEGGRGLFIVAQLARDWGWSPCSDGKCIWATL